MKSARLLFFLLSLFFKSTSQSTDSSTKAAEILIIEQGLMDAISEGNKVVWEKYLDINCIIITEDGSSQTKSEMIDGIHPFSAGYSGNIKVLRPHFTFHGKVAVLNYVADEHEIVFGQQLHTTYAVANTYYFDEDGWKIIAGQLFEVPQLPAAIKVSTKILQSYTGSYELTKGTIYTIRFSEGVLYGQKNGKQKEALLPETNNVFFKKSDTRGRKLFLNDDHGVLWLRERRNGQDLVWKKIS